MINLDDLLNSFDEDAPSGADLEYDAEFVDLTIASTPGEERVVGDSVILAEEPDYPAVIKAATALLGRTRDLRIAVILANAALKSEGLLAFEEVLLYIRRCLEEYWDSVHPQLDADDDDDPTMRVNAMLGLTDRALVLGALRTAPLTESRTFGRFGLRDLLVAEGELPAGEMQNAPTDQVVSAAFQDTDPAHLEALARSVAASSEHVKALSAAFDERIGSLGPDFTPLRKMLYDISRRLDQHVGAETGEVAGALSDDDRPAASDASPAAAATAAARPAGVGTITSPDDVKKAIDRIVEYYARQEPSSPVPILLKRARRLVSADFLEIMKDMAPQGVENVALIGGFENDDS
ncbi:type VI secretion system protein TssA [Rhizobium halophytocola]|uniref:Type VI secretion system protein ImpA n=1 Tax=Rhizobium halophytocola TaxID=735519 RepID=A0ABS4E3I3_9HYPH|nr:type VI secretion system protein TssA [Rhizobium halophytocola]MBP1852478.1 type VI secretion system protein ImpA [Rhizobium halophytocola]